MTDVRFDDSSGSLTLRYKWNFGRNWYPGLSGERAEHVDSLSLVALTSVSVITKGEGYRGLAVTLYEGTHQGAINWWISTYVSLSDVREAANLLRLIAIEAQRKRDALDAAEFERFKPSAKSWREMQPTPEIPEEVRRRNVIAENAIKEKDFAKASEEYDAALKEYPTWPQGQFNLAYISGETKAYRAAILHMKCYLELVPDAPDAQAARDKLIIWQDKIRTNLENEIAETPARPVRR